MPQHPGGSQGTDTSDANPHFPPCLKRISCFSALYTRCWPTNLQGLFPSSPWSVPLDFTWDCIQIRSLNLCGGTFTHQTIFPVSCDSYYYTSGPHFIPLLKRGMSYLSLGDRPYRPRDHHWLSQTS